MWRVMEDVGLCRVCVFSSLDHMRFLFSHHTTPHHTLIYQPRPTNHHPLRHLPSLTTPCHTTATTHTHATHEPHRAHSTQTQTHTTQNTQRKIHVRKNEPKMIRIHDGKIVQAKCAGTTTGTAVSTPWTTTFQSAFWTGPQLVHL